MIISIIAVTTFRLIWLSYIGHLDYEQHPQVKNGVLDLRDWEFSTYKTLRLDGEWEFYPSEFVESPPQTDTYITVPNKWEQYFNNKQEYYYGTYRLRILVDEHAAQLFAARVSDIRNSLIMSVNGEKVKQFGKPAATLQQYEAARLTPFTAKLTPVNGEIEIIIQAASNITGGGMIKPIRFGLEEAIQKRALLSVSMQILLALFLLIHSVYAIILYFLGARNRALLYFSIITIAGLVSVLSSDDRLLFVFYDIDYFWRGKIIFLSYIVALSFIPALLYCLFPDHISKKPLRVYNLLSTIYGAFILLAPPTIVYQSGISLSIFLVISGLLSAYILWVAFRRKEDVIFLLIASVFLLINIVWSVILSRSSVEFITYPFDLIFALVAFATFWFRRFFSVTEEANKLTVQLQQEHERKDAFLLNTSHELRNPLHGMINLTEAMLRDDEQHYTDEQRSQLHILLRVSRHLSQLVENLLDMTRLKEQIITLNERAFSSHTIVAGVIEIMRVSLGGKPVQLNNNIPDDFPLLFGDEQRFTQIMYNLIQNAVKFTDAGEITVRGRTDGNWAIIEVEDSGMGISPTDIEKVFNAYMQGESKAAAAGQGVGVGLNICKELVELHGGSIEVQSIYGKGAIFSFTFPLLGENIVTTDESIEKISESVEPFAEISSTISGEINESYAESYTEMQAGHYKILVVDDDHLNLEIIHYLLQTDGFDVITTDDPENALPLIKEHAFDLVISDVMMPEMSGFELTRQIRTRYSPVELPILLLTARTRSEDIIAGFQAGANDYLTKPVEAWELRARTLSLAKLKVTLENHIRMEGAWLQSQIQPHFIFNTLNSIASLGMFDFEKMQELLEEFSNYLRLSFDFKNAEPTVALSHELSLVRSYLYIEKKRFEDHIEIEWDVNPNLEFKLPPLTIQPLVENALKHGLLKKNGGGQICIKITEEENHYTISVKDTGVGMTAEELEALRENKAIPNKQETTGTRVGLKNINLRLKQLYNEQLHIDSTLGVETTISFQIPK